MQDFFARILPDTGYYVLTIGTPKQDGSGGQWFRNYRYSTKSDLEAAAVTFDNRGQTVFYALGAFQDNLDVDPVTERQKITRLAAQAKTFRAFGFDIDLSKKTPQGEVVLYADQRAAISAMLAACQILNLPAPLFVSSGRGVHCYYPLTHDISTLQWRRASEALRAAFLDAGMEFDTSKICDPAMVLRPVGTHNRKGGQQLPVAWFPNQPATVFDPVQLIGLILKATGKTKLATGGSPRRASAVADAILNTDFPPATPADVESRCPQVAAVAAAAGNVAEPLWYAVLGIAAYCEDSENTAIRWSNGHPTFNRAATLRKMEQWKAKSGPTTCAHFEKIDPALCASCPHKGRIGSPVQLSTTGATTIQVAEHTLRLPKNYIERGGRLFKVFEDELIPACDYLMFPSRRYKDEHSGKSMCLLEVKLPREGWKTLELPMDVAGGGLKEFSVWAVNHQLFIHSEVMLKNTRHYIMTYLQELQLETESEVLCSTFGWYDDSHDSFVLGERHIRPKITETVRLGDTASQFATIYSPHGELAKWSSATALFELPELEHHGLVFLMGMGSPLMAGTGLKSVLVNMYSPESGTGKSTTGCFINSVYGHPERTKLTVEDTQNATFKSMGVYGNLPVYIDEITTIEAKQLGKVIYFMTQGREKKRMTKSGGFQESAEWENISLSSSNRDLYDILTDRMSNDGESMRILQFPFVRNRAFSSASPNYGLQVNRLLAANYGVAGEPFLRSVMLLGGPHAVIDRATNKFEKEFKFIFTGKERFWKAATVIAYATGEIGKATGLLQFDHKRCIAKGLEYIESLRKDMDDARLDCFDIIGTYLSEHMGKVVVWGNNLTAKRSFFRDPVPTHEVVARVEYDFNESSPFVSGALFLNQVHFGRWCSDRGVDRNGVFAQFAQFGVRFSKDRRLSLMRGTNNPLPAVRACEINMQHPRWIDVLQQSAIGAAPPALQIISGAKV